MALRFSLHRRLGALALVCGLLATTALPVSAAAPPAAATPAAAEPGAAAGGGLGALVADWLHRLLGERDPSPPPADGDVLDSRHGPAGPLIDPDGYAPKDPRPQDGHGHRR